MRAGESRLLLNGEKKKKKRTFLTRLTVIGAELLGRGRRVGENTDKDLYSGPIKARGEISEEIMTVGRPGSLVLLRARRIQRTGAGSQPAPTHTDIVHCDVSSYF